MSVVPSQDLVNYLQGQIYTWVAVAVVGLIGFIVTAGLWFWRNRTRTKIGKTIDYAKGKQGILLLAASLGSHAKLFFAREFNPEGVLETKKFKDRAKGKQRRKIYKPPRKINVGSATELMNIIEYPEGATDIQKLETAELTRQMVQTMIDKTNEKVFLEGVGVPISVVVEDKVITANIPGLGAVEFYKKLGLVQRLGPKIKSLLADVDFKDVGEALLYLYSKISIVPFDFIREYFDESYDQSNEDAQNEWHHMQGYRDGVASAKKGSDTGKLFLYMGLAGIIGGCVIAAIGLYLGK